MIYNTFELRPQNQNLNLFKKKNGKNNMLSDSSKNVFKMALEDPQKILLKSTKNMKLSGFFIHFWGLNYQSYQLVEASFQ